MCLDASGSLKPPGPPATPLIRASTYRDRAMTMRSEMLETLAATEPLAGEWDDLAQTLGRPYCAPGWLLPWWRHVAPDKALLRIAVARDDDGRLAGVAPFYAARRRGVWTYRLLAAGLAARVEPLVRPDSGEEALRALAREIAGADAGPRTRAARVGPRIGAMERAAARGVARRRVRAPPPRRSGADRRARCRRRRRRRRLAQAAVVELPQPDAPLPPAAGRGRRRLPRDRQPRAARPGPARVRAAAPRPARGARRHRCLPAGRLRDAPGRRAGAAAGRPAAAGDDRARGARDRVPPLPRGGTRALLLERRLRRRVRAPAPLLRRPGRCRGGGHRGRVRALRPGPRHPGLQVPVRRRRGRARVGRAGPTWCARGRRPGRLCAGAGPLRGRLAPVRRAQGVDQDAGYAAEAIRSRRGDAR